MTPLFIKAIKAPKKRTPTVQAEAPPSGQANLGRFADLLGLLATHKAGGDFGPDSVDVGHHVAFRAGEFAGSGKVTATGRDGLCVTDASKREHRVHWREVTGHFAPDAESKKTGSQKPKQKKADRAA